MSWTKNDLILLYFLPLRSLSLREITRVLVHISDTFPSSFCFLPLLLSFVGPVDINLMSKCAPCLSAPCQNNGTCVSNAAGSYHCTCPYGFKVRISADRDALKVAVRDNVSLLKLFFLVHIWNYNIATRIYIFLFWSVCTLIYKFD